MNCDVEELRTLFLFEKLSDEQLAWLCEQGHVELIEPGWVYREGQAATCFYVLLDGAVVLTRLIGGDDVEVGRTDQRGVYGGAFQAYLGDRIRQVYNNSMRVPVASRFFVLDAERFALLMRDWFPMALHMLEGLFFGSRTAQEVIGQRERLLALGSLTAGLTHELNNPAAAAVRATSLLRERVAGMRRNLALTLGASDNPAILDVLIGLQEDAVESVTKAPTPTPMEAADLEDELGTWLDAHSIDDGWDLAPTFVQAGIGTTFLDRVEAAVDTPALAGAIRWLNYSVETEMLMEEIHDSTTRVTTLVMAAKQYSQMDRAPYQVADVTGLLDSTLLMMGGRIGADITVIKDYERSAPEVPAYAAELNQVWTNLIDNAVSAMAGQGTLTIKTRVDGDYLLVEIGDTGPGVPEQVRDRIFEPFFTTKPFGEGTGLGLDISWRIVVNKHHGDLSVVSEPGDTRFGVRLPLRAGDDVPADAPGPGDPAVRSVHVAGPVGGNAIGRAGRGLLE